MIHQNSGHSLHSFITIIIWQKRTLAIWCRELNEINKITQLLAHCNILYFAVEPFIPALSPNPKVWKISIFFCLLYLMIVQQPTPKLSKIPINHPWALQQENTVYLKNFSHEELSWSLLSDGKLLKSQVRIDTSKT